VHAHTYLISRGFVFVVVIIVVVCQALRLLLGCMSSHAARHKKYIVPLLSLSIDFYVRVFVRVYTSAAIVKRSAAYVAMAWWVW
jgi:tRNA G26 N,N-dimethylase Trm1